MKKEIPIVCLPTTEASNLTKSLTSDKLFFSKDIEQAKLHIKNEGAIPHFLYALSSEKCKKGEWKYCSFTNEISQYDPLADKPGTGWCEECKKIIATNNPELWKKWSSIPVNETDDGGYISDVPKLPLSLIEHYAKFQPKSVMFEYEEMVSVPQEHLLTGSDVEIEARKNPTLQLKLTPSGEVIWSPVDPIEQSIEAMDKLLEENPEFVKQAIDEVDAKFHINEEHPRAEVDLEKLAQTAYKIHSVSDDRLSLDEQIQRSGGFIVGFKTAYNQALQQREEVKEESWDSVREKIKGLLTLESLELKMDIYILFKLLEDKATAFIVSKKLAIDTIVVQWVFDFIRDNIASQSSTANKGEGISKQEMLDYLSKNWITDELSEREKVIISAVVTRINKLSISHPLDREELLRWVEERIVDIQASENSALYFYQMKDKLLSLPPQKQSDAVEFAEWISNNQFNLLNNEWASTKIEYVGHYYTAKQLYQIFKSDPNK